MKFHTLAEWLAWQETLHPSEIELGLERVKNVAARLPFFAANLKIKTITVGGTNGKGSCVAYLEAILIAAGYRVGAYSSPHLLRYNERVRVNGAMVSDQTLCDSFERVDMARGASPVKRTSLTYFEFGTLAALDIFFREKVDVQILEVGLGGRLDAVNIMEPDAAIVTNVALDHEAWLGDNRESIGKEKAGIFRKGIPLIIGEPKPPASIKQAASYLNNGKLRIYGKDFCIEEPTQENSIVWSFKGTDSQGAEVHCLSLPKGKLPLPSAACALQVIVELKLADQRAVETGLQSAFIPGRCQQIEWQGRKIILDVAHNPAGAQYLASWLQQNIKEQVSVVFSALADKDHAGLMSALAPLASDWYLAPLPVPRAAKLENLLESAASIRARAQQFDTIGAALEQAVAESGAGATVLIYGSFYTVAEALKFLQSLQ